MTVFSGKVLAITGAASGIGQALAEEAARRGADVALSDVDEAGLARTVKLVQAQGREAIATRVDVSKREEVEAWASATLEGFGRCDAIVNNAGVTVSDTVLDISYEDFEWIVGINFWGVVYGTKAFLPHFVERDTGWVVNVSSVFGMIGFPTQGSYNATKFAVRGMTEALRWELESTNVTVCSVHPGGIKTNIVRNGRLRRAPNAETTPDEMITSFDKMARTTPTQAANVILDGMAKREPRILIGADARMIDAMQRIAPRRYGTLMKRVADRLERAGR